MASGGAGFDVTNLTVQWHKKIAYPLMAPVSMLLAIPFAFFVGTRGALGGVALGVGIGVAYWAMAALLEAMGSVGQLPPQLSGWRRTSFSFFLGFVFFLQDCRRKKTKPSTPGKQTECLRADGFKYYFRLIRVEFLCYSPSYSWIVLLQPLLELQQAARRARGTVNNSHRTTARWQNFDAIRVAAVFAADAQLDAGARFVPLLHGHGDQLAHSRLVDRSEGFFLTISSSWYGPRKEPESSRLMPRHVCVRSFVPKLKNSAVCAISSAVECAARHLNHGAQTR